MSGGSALGPVAAGGESPCAVWDPWQVLADLDDVVYAVERLPDRVGAVYARRGDRAAIVIDDRLGPVEHRAALAHELVHHERGPPPRVVPDTLRCVVIREEVAVDREVARRLVPRALLARFVAGRNGLGAGVGVADVAAEFEVPERLARWALQELDVGGGGCGGRA